MLSLALARGSKGKGPPYLVKGRVEMLEAASIQPNSFNKKKLGVSA